MAKESQQAQRVKRMRTEPIYLIDISADRRTFKISGSTANLYTVKFDETQPTMETAMKCDCPDAKVYCKRYGVVCKHSCFVFLKILAIPERILTATELTEDDRRVISLGLERTHVLQTVHESYRKKYLQRCARDGDVPESPEPPSPGVQEEPSECPICFDVMTDGSGCSKCTTCRNSIHGLCIAKWLAMGKTTCVYCRAAWRTGPTQEPQPVRRRAAAKTGLASGYLNLEE